MSATHAAYALGVTDTINVGKGPEGIAYDSGRGEIYVANWASGTVSVISDSTDKVTNMTVGTEPTDVAYDSGRGEVFVSAGLNTVLVIPDSGIPVPEFPGVGVWAVVVASVAAAVLLSRRFQASSVKALEPLGV